jgi:hypothetical protein
MEGSWQAGITKYPDSTAQKARNAWRSVKCVWWPGYTCCKATLDWDDGGNDLEEAGTPVTSSTHHQLHWPLRWHSSAQSPQSSCWGRLPFTGGSYSNPSSLPPPLVKTPDWEILVLSFPLTAMTIQCPSDATCTAPLLEARDVDVNPETAIGQDTQEQLQLPPPTRPSSLTGTPLFYSYKIYLHSHSYISTRNLKENSFIASC